MNDLEEIQEETRPQPEKADNKLTKEEKDAIKLQRKISKK